MKIRLVEEFEEDFDFSEELEYDASDIIDAEDSGKVCGSVNIKVSSDDIVNFFQEHIDIDEHPELEDDLNQKKYLKEHYEELWEEFADELYDYYKEYARDKIYDNWDDYCIEDESQYDDRADLLRDYYRSVL